jgi:pyruvate dehydrogenase E1 component alpha subunit
MPGVTVDGADFFAVYEAAEEAIGRARRGEGPSLVECRGFRYYGHFQGDSMLYFTEEEKERNRARDPIPAIKKKVLERKLLTEAEMADIEAKAAARIEEAVKFAEESPLPESHEVLTDVYVKYP